MLETNNGIYIILYNNYLRKHFKMNAIQSHTIGLFQEQVQLVPYVSTDLHMVELTLPEATNQDVIRAGVTFRRLNADYFVWIEQTIAQVKKAHTQGRIPSQAFSELMKRYRVIQQWIEENVSRKVLKAARKRSSLAEYNPPKAAQQKPYLYPATGDWKFTRLVLPEAVAKVDAIRDRALDCGWTEARLYQNRSNLRYPCGSEWGLVCSLNDGETIGEALTRYIEIITRNSVVRKFYISDVDQQWIKRAKTSAHAGVGSLKQPLNRNRKLCR